MNPVYNFNIKAVPVRNPATVILEKGKAALKDRFQFLNLTWVIIYGKFMTGRPITLNLVQLVEVQQPSDNFHFIY